MIHLSSSLTTLGGTAKMTIFQMLCEYFLVGTYQFGFNKGTWKKSVKKYPLPNFLDSKFFIIHDSTHDSIMTDCLMY